MNLHLEGVAFSTATLASFGAIISTLEWLHLRRKLRPGEVFDRQPSLRKPAAGLKALLARPADLLLAYPSFLGVLIARLLLLLLLPFSLTIQRGEALVLGLVFLSDLLVNVRSPQSTEGSDHMATHIFGALFLGYLGGTRLTLCVSLFYIAAQSCLAYFTGGVSKVISPHWRRGNAIFLVLNSQTFGNRHAALWLADKPGLTRALGWGTMIMECLFPLALFLGFPGCLIFLGWGVLFHSVNAVLLGLNSFIWSFGATYPAILFCSVMISGWLRGDPLSFSVRLG
jgi:hypothetical protein